MAAGIRSAVRTIRLLGIVAAQAVMNGAAVISNALSDQIIQDMKKDLEANRAARLTQADLPEWSKELFKPADRKDSN